MRNENMISFTDQPPLSWNVYVNDINHRHITPYNIFTHQGFLDGCRKAIKKFNDDKDGFSKQLDRMLRYYYWGKCEWEITLGEWPPSVCCLPHKIDVYNQIMLNKDIFIDYLWENRGKLI